MPKVLTKFEPPTPAEIMAFLRTGRWPKTDEQERAEHVAGVRDQVLAGIYESPVKLALACARMLPDVVDRPNLADDVAQRMQAEWDQQNDGDRFE